MRGDALSSRSTAARLLPGGAIRVDSHGDRAVSHLVPHVGETLTVIDKYLDGTTKLIERHPTRCRLRRIQNEGNGRPDCAAGQQSGQGRAGRYAPFILTRASK